MESYSFYPFLSVALRLIWVFSCLSCDYQFPKLDTGIIFQPQPFLQHELLFNFESESVILCLNLGIRHICI